MQIHNLPPASPKLDAHKATKPNTGAGAAGTPAAPSFAAVLDSAKAAQAEAKPEATTAARP